MRGTFEYLNQRKATGPDNLHAFSLKTFAAKLLAVWQPIYFSFLLTLTQFLKCGRPHIKCLFQKQACRKKLGDYRHGEMTPVIMKTFERTVIQQLTNEAFT